jgi:hypothetical protein
MTGAKGATLIDIIECGDYLNHSIFSAAELRSGLAKLLAAGCIKETKGRWIATRSKAVFDLKVFTDPQKGVPGWSHPLSDDVIRQAIDAYVKKF